MRFVYVGGGGGTDRRRPALAFRRHIVIMRPNYHSGIARQARERPGELANAGSGNVLVAARERAPARRSGAGLRHGGLRCAWSPPSPLAPLPPLLSSLRRSQAEFQVVVLPGPVCAAGDKPRALGDPDAPCGDMPRCLRLSFVMPEGAYDEACRRLRELLLSV